MKKITVTLYRSPIGRVAYQKRVVKGLGLHKVGQTVEHEDKPDIRGMVAKVPHLVRINEA
ncbi:MAG TPA: 50S ribosomal protein L30 [Candidatus Latescibacteria bacterium]|nr:50S ribosomal protein L30 [Candidatus Latescibacterota bacterium]HOT36748.1 50S ribosomal protein L30 [Candidatus Latescibacterota bacterium]HPC44597.1 50S ribosomal protein L30 [Candidatus Latescibacterota bacterium]HQI77656.1 50S ribosomal protein L30 [Candidatus Latescibacterota bacterium]HQK21423.1 50S ribosomal protein L30 [Candidatus Latescibacterota bacterium]